MSDEIEIVTFDGGWSAWRYRDTLLWMTPPNDLTLPGIPYEIPSELKPYNDKG